MRKIFNECGCCIGSAEKTLSMLDRMETFGQFKKIELLISMGSYDKKIVVNLVISANTYFLLDRWLSRAFQTHSVQSAYHMATRYMLSSDFSYYADRQRANERERTCWNGEFKDGEVTRNWKENATSGLFYKTDLETERFFYHTLPLEVGPPLHKEFLCESFFHNKLTLTAIDTVLKEEITDTIRDRIQSWGYFSTMISTEAYTTMLWYGIMYTLILC